MRSPFRCLHLALFLVALAIPAESQVSSGVRPFVGYYYPLGQFDHAEILSTALPQRPSDLRGIAWGGDLQMKFRQRFAVDGMVVTATSTLPSCTCPGGPTGEVPVRVNIATVEAQYDLSLMPSRYQLWAGVGPAVIQHRGRGYEQPESPVSWGGAFGLDFTAALARHWQLVATGTGVAYAFNLDSPPQHGSQLDALLSVGLRWHRGQ
ncbi:MAG TPA: hypothetical protein VIP11_17905 [Gemmatimonadaceae bacterium]